MDYTTLTRRCVVFMAVFILGMAPRFITAQTQQDAVETLRSDLKADRTAFVAEQMQLSDQESEKFWPVYRSYRAEVDQLTDSVVKLILEYIDLYPHVPERKAKDLLDQYTKIEERLLDVKRKYLKKLGKVLPASKVFRFAQLDNRFDLGVRLGLAASIPVLNTGQTRPAQGR